MKIFCWNIANPSITRAVKQCEWLKKERSEDIFVLTETKNSEGYHFINRYFAAYGYFVYSTLPDNNEYGSMIISRKNIKKSSFVNSNDYLHYRTTSVITPSAHSNIEIIGTYIPSRDTSMIKINRKKDFIRSLASKLDKNSIDKNNIIFCGDLNILEPNHHPSYSFFRDWEYDFYIHLQTLELVDAFRYLHPNKNEYSWVGKTGDGYRYDHFFVSKSLLNKVNRCEYVHTPRELIPRLSDHSAIVLELG